MIFIGLGAAQVVTDMRSWGGFGNKAGQFNEPLAIDVSPSGTIYVVDTGNHRIQLFEADGTYIKSIGGFGFQPDQFDSPRDIWVRSVNNIYVSDYYNRRLQRYDRQMNLISSFSSNPAIEQQYMFGEVASAVVTSQNDLFLLDHEEYKIVKFNRNLEAEQAFGRFDSGAGELDTPEQLDMWGADRLVVSDPPQKAVVVFDLFGSFLKKISVPEFQRPRGLAVGPKQALYVADPAAGRVFRISRDGKEIQALRFADSLAAPQDVALMQSGDDIRIFILDGNLVKTGRLQLP